MGAAGRKVSPLRVDLEEMAPDPQRRGEEWIVGAVVIALVLVLAILYAVVPVLPVGAGASNDSMEILRYLFGRSSM